MVAMFEVQDQAARASVRSEALADRLFGAAVATMDTALVHLGHRLGLYHTLANLEPATSGEVAQAAGLHERYVREWLEQQTVSGFLECENPHANAGERRYVLPPGHAEVLLDIDHPLYLAPMPQVLMGALSGLPELTAAFRTGAGIPAERIGPDLRTGLAGMHRNLFLQDLGLEYLAQIPEVHARLSSEVPARIADIGCGVGWSAIGMARAYPNVLVDGFGLDTSAVREARHLARAYDVADRVQVHLGDASDPHLDGRYDLVTAFACVQDLGDPVSALRTMRRLAGVCSTVLIMAARVADAFDPAAGDVERYLYGFSVLHGLPAGLASQPSAGTGTVMRPDTLRGYARHAGFADIDILPLAHPFVRFYRLVR